ncbi:MAG: apolipoprotein N-acyltransferase [Alphaproteobacteria bacterium]
MPDRKGPGRLSWLIDVATRLADRGAAVAGWRRCLAAVVMGAVAATALPPWHVVPLLVPAFVGLVWLMDGSRSARTGFFVGWCFGLGHSLVGIHWIVSPLLVEPERHAWLIPFALGGLSAGLAVFPAIAVALTVAAMRAGLASGAARVPALAGFWLAAEWVRGWALTGFPWNLIGYVWADMPAMFQLSALAGIHGLSLMTVLAAAAPALLADRPEGGSSTMRGAVWIVVALTLALPAAVWAGGAFRLSEAPPPGGHAFADVRLRLVQANIPQRLKWLPELREAHLLKHVSLSRRRSNGQAPPTHVIWPEAAVPFFLASDPTATKVAVEAIPPDGLLITGSPRAEDMGGQRMFWNSVHAVDGTSSIVATYDKSHLVPFGEYVPFRGILPIDRIVPGQGDFTPGAGRATLRLDGLPPLSPLICYEAIFPAAAVDRRDRPDWILSLTNDAWFGSNAGPKQHFAIARMRSVEEGLALVRVANTGISAIVDPYGRVLERLGIGEEGIIDGALPVPLDEPTPFSRLGQWTVAVLFALSSAGVWLLRLMYRFRPGTSREIA